MEPELQQEKITEETDVSLAPYYFHQGSSESAYDYLGAHKTATGWFFRVWAPNADSVYLAGDFNGWSDSTPMRRVTEAGVWEVFLAGAAVRVGMFYKYRIVNHGEVMLKADPYAVCAECPPGTASVVCEIDGYEWHDADWLAHRRATLGGDGRGIYSMPMHIYELHAGSWKRHEDGTLLSWRELARELAPYVKQMGYTHIELMPVMDHPYDGSWGYQVCGYYAPSARFGTPQDLMYFIDAMHGAGIGVILDWVPAHFPKDAHGLYEFDGQPLYEYQGKDRMEHAGWGTRRFDVGRPEVESFLVSNAVFWTRLYHADGLRVDAVASMLYLDYDRLPGEWVPNIYGDNRCLEAVAFFQKLNACMRRNFPDVMMIAEESSAWANITGFENGGLGFTFKWDMGWMNDTLAYAELDPVYRSYHHDKLTFGMMYAFSEHYVLPISHDEVVHGKKSFLDKMPGTYEEKFASDRAFMTYMMTRPGKKLTFMGSEIGQFREWDFAGSIEWFLLGYDSHAKLQRFYADLNHFYLEHPPLWQVDDNWEGFRWIDAEDKEESVLTYYRTDREGRMLLICLNFTPVERAGFRVGVPCAGTWKEIFNSDDERFGGSGIRNGEPLVSGPEPQNGMEESVTLTLPPLSGVILELTAPRKKKKKAAGTASPRTRKSKK